MSNRVQSFGAGVQSVTILRKILAGEIAPVDAVVFADTQAEPEHVYQVLAREQKLCKKAGIPFHVVTWRGLLQHTRDSLPPLFTLSPNGKKGALFRVCTDRYKLQPIRELIRKLKWHAEGVDQLLGISTDEIMRVKPSRLSYITNSYPLIELNMSRRDCETYLASIGVSAAKSACVICPYSPTSTWQAIRQNENDWRKAVAYDKAIRNVMGKRSDLLCFTHYSCKPLEEAVLLESPNMFDSECEGHCGL